MHCKSKSSKNEYQPVKDEKVERVISVVAIGCGSRTKIYATLMAQLRGRFSIVAVSDPVAERRRSVKAIYGDPSVPEFDSAEALLQQTQLADLAIIATPDSQHCAQAISAMRRGYDLLLEKPIATSLEDVAKVALEAERLNRKVVVCHVLRYSPFYQKIKSIVDSGRLGKVVSMQATEGVGAFHHAHSFVRGHWRNEEATSPMILAKSCHDLDILQWIAGSPCSTVTSVGGIRYFKQDSAPPNSTASCIESCPHVGHCEYDAHKYLKSESQWLSYVLPDLDAETSQPEATKAWLANSQWNRCVFQCDNTAVDHQVVQLVFENSVTASFTMTAFAKGRTLEIYGTEACLRCGEFYKETFGSDMIISDHFGGTTEQITVDIEELGYRGHGGGDMGLVKALETIMDSQDEKHSAHLVTESVESHLMAFAAHESRKHGGIPVSVADFRTFVCE
jgi:predicted dehydrogenase